MKLNNILRYVIGTALILSVPLVAMMFSDEWDWGLFDFIVIGALLMGTGLAYEFITNKVDARHRGTIAIVLVATMLLIWVEMAVGLFGSPIAGS